MGLVANLPIALAPGKSILIQFVSHEIYFPMLNTFTLLCIITGMGMNAYFTYSVVGFRGTVSQLVCCMVISFHSAT
jgi:xanthine/uracil/vitamin C permease (AzgA family)